MVGRRVAGDRDRPGVHLRPAEVDQDGRPPRGRDRPPLAFDIAAARPDAFGIDDLVAPSQTGGFLNWNNWRNWIWNPAVIRAGFFRESTKRGRTVKTTVAPYDLRHSFASLLIHEGRNPLLVAAAMGHSSGQLIWSTYGHLFEDARLAPSTPMVEAIDAARQELHRSCTDAAECGVAARVQHERNTANTRGNRRAGDGVEPATSSLGKLALYQLSYVRMSAEPTRHPSGAGGRRGLHPLRRLHPEQVEAGRWHRASRGSGRAGRPRSSGASTTRQRW